MYSKKLLRAVCQTAEKVYIAETRRRPQPYLWPVSLKVSGCSSNLKENVSDNIKYSYLIYWAFMFLPQLGCYGLRRNLRRDCITYLIWITIRNSLVKETALVGTSFFLNQCICLAQHWTLYITCWRLSHTWYKKNWTKPIRLHDFWWRTVWNDLM